MTDSSNKAPQKTRCAELTWDANNEPSSSEFDDVYFSKDNGLDESRYVFLRGNQLQARWQQLSGNTFCIAETGFGTGLNFLATWQLWNQCDTQNAELTYISVEKYPLSPEALKRALGAWPQLAELAALLLQNYPPQPWQGLQNIELKAAGASDQKQQQNTAPIKTIRLLLYFGDSNDAWPELSTLIQAQPELAEKRPAFGERQNKVDAWFLDGFAPAKNPEMWQSELFQAMQANSQAGTSVATFTCAGTVKRGLKAHGFSIQKIPGFGRKREMLIASFTGDTACENADHSMQGSSANSAKKNHLNNPSKHNQTNTAAAHAINKRRLKTSRQANWLLIPERKMPNTTQARALIIGAGMAGAQIARRLAEQGLPCTVLEKNHIASQASGNPAGAVYTRLGLGNDTLSEFNLAAQMYADQFYQQGNYYQNCGQACGVLHLSNNKNHKRHLDLIKHYRGEQFALLDRQQASLQCGIELNTGGLWLKQSGWLSPPRLCRQLLEHSLIDVHENCEALSLEQSGANWRVICQNREFFASHVIVASAYEAQQFPELKHLTLKRIRGQVSFLDSDEQLKTLRAVICGEGYLTPAQQTPSGPQHCAGATFSLSDTSCELTQHDHQKNLDALSSFLPGFDGSDKHLQGRVAFRTTSPDYLPLLGPVNNIKLSLERFAALRHKANADIAELGAPYPGLYCALAFGSRGLAYSPLAARLICDLILGRHLPVRRTLYAALHPMRFEIRNLIQNKKTRAR
ncbi:FAD-dependent 5-carboxymethylaminomethyl-2-thiouridine(34) oxidoreductase MnmC [Agaribacterium haliotis]|uniref:FAD-dependent 5-carboxymethylaminomethyl-2-thiouridine(34) oxidoreductase MnmC n=1 Tax=Agaribacterium haliotis TaxID=2013869 RepID=UPI0013047C4E|nr:FAD-dependent 5-carboxymethylaminomethyl-2-thiouridine(34) oxidoreductase MnmC [Agaribacterium haliotis]